MPVEPRTRRGHDPRPARSRAAVLRAAANLLARTGYHGATIERIAADSGVAKTTIYRHWRSRQALLVDAVEALGQPPPAAPDGGTLRADLLLVLEGLAQGLTAGQWAHALPALIEGAERDRPMSQALRTLMAARAQPLRVVLERAVLAGHLAAPVDLDTVIAELAGPLFYRRLVTREPVDAALAAQVVDDVLRARAVATSASTPGAPRRERSPDGQ